MLKLITKHLDKSGIKVKIEKIDSICAFTGEAIQEGVRLSELIKDTFTDHSYIRYDSEYASVEIAMLLQMTVKTESGYNCIRNYSFIATEKALRLLKREEILQHIICPPKEPFYFCVTYSNKKHVAFKSRLNEPNQPIYIETDKGTVLMNTVVLNVILPIIQSWYSIPESEKQKATPKTYFTKSQILGESEPTFQQVKEYGIERFEAENDLLNRFRVGPLLELLVFCLNK